MQAQDRTGPVLRHPTVLAAAWTVSTKSSSVSFVDPVLGGRQDGQGEAQEGPEQQLELHLRQKEEKKEQIRIVLCRTCTFLSFQSIGSPFFTIFYGDRENVKTKLVSKQKKNLL